MMKTLPFAGPCKLPTKESVLKLYYSLRSLDRFSRRSDVPDIVAKLTKQYWIMAKIPAVDDRTVASRLSMLVKQYDTVVKNKSKTNQKQVVQRESFEADLSKIFELASQSAEEDMKKDRLLGNKEKSEDLIFLEDQRGPRLGHIAGQDFVFAKAVDKKLERENRERKRHHDLASERVNEQNNNELANQDFANEVPEDFDQSDVDFSSPSSSKKKKTATVQLEIPCNVFNHLKLLVCLID